MDSNGKIKSSKHKDKRKSSRYVPYARGFKIPSKEKQLRAIGFNEDKIPPAFLPKSKDEAFPSIPRPTSIDDWLAQYDEEGQTFKQFLDECPWLSKRKFKYIKHKFVSNGETIRQKYPDGKIYVVPIGYFYEDSCLKFEDLLDYARRFLCLPIETLPELEVKFTNGQLVHVEEAGQHPSGRKSRRREVVIDTRYDPKSKHFQINVGSMLQELRRKIPQDALCVIGLTLYDLYGDEPDLFVAGMAAGNQNVAVFSVLRYDPRVTFSEEFWHDIKKTKIVQEPDLKRLILQRSCKLVVHEIGHLLGIDHCIYFDCCMNGSGHLEEDFRQPMHLCPVDLHKLQVLTGFNVVERYEKLLQFYRKHGLEEEAQWVNRRLQFIKEETEKSSMTLSTNKHTSASGKTRSRSSRSRKSRRSVPFVKGFKLPSKQEQIDAIGFDVDETPPEFNPAPHLKFFKSIPRPTSVDDWLAQYNVSGQTFTDYISKCSWLSGRKSKSLKQKFVPLGKTLSEKFPEGKIYIVPLGKFDEESCFNFEELVDFARQYLSLPLETLKYLDMHRDGEEIILGNDPEVSPVMQTRYSSDTDHIQIHVNSLLSELQMMTPSNALCVVGLTQYDLYAADSDLFVAGMASGSRGVAVFSVHRYNPRLTFSPEFWYDISETVEVSEQEKSKLLLQRSCKLVVHEIGHLLGIAHCKFYNCCMNGSGHLEEDFRQPMHLCPVDLHKLQVLTGFHVVERYEKLLQFYRKHGLEEEAHWVNRRLQFIKEETESMQKKLTYL